VPYSISRAQGVQVLNLEGEICIRHVRDLAALLIKEMDAGMRVEIHTRGLQRVDTAVLQLLCSVRRTATELTAPNPNEVFVAAVNRCGLRRQLLCGKEDI